MINSAFLNWKQKHKCCSHPASPPQRLVKDIMHDILGHDFKHFRFQVQALVALQEASEAFLAGLFEDSMVVLTSRKKVELMTQDIKVACRLKSYCWPSQLQTFTHSWKIELSFVFGVSWCNTLFDLLHGKQFWWNWPHVYKTYHTSSLIV